MEEQRLILVVEDDEATRAFLLDNLAADGYRVSGASAAGEGLRAIEVRQPSLVVLDLRLDDGSGYALLDRIRGADGHATRVDPDLPVIVLSGRAGDADRVRSFARGADDHLCKPFLYAELLARVRAVLRRSEGRRARGLLRIGELTVDSGRALCAAGAAGGSSCRPRSSRCCAPWPRSPRACSASRSCCATSGATARRAARARSTPTPAGCGASSTARAGRSCVNVRGVGYKLTEAA